MTEDQFIIPLTRGQSTIVDAEDSDLAAHKWLAVKSGDVFYVYRSVARKTVALHRVIVARKIGRELTKSELVDHANHNPLDNRRSNLRLATASQNRANSKCPKRNLSGLKGAIWIKRRQSWEAQITFNHHLYIIGTFPTAEAAHEAYKDVAVKVYGEFAYWD